MALATDKKQLSSSSNSIAVRLMQKRDEILSLWAERVRTGIPTLKNERHPIIVNTLPVFLENLGEALVQRYPRELASEGSSIASEHGGERARLTRISPEDLMKEYQILRDVLFEKLNEGDGLSEKDSSIILKSIDHAMGESLTAYFLVHEGLREQFTNILTHDLRNPLTAIQVSADILFRNPDRAYQVRKMALRIVHNVQRIDRMTQDLLDVSRIRLGEKLNFEVSECELSSLTQQTIDQLIPVYGDRFILEGKTIHGYWNAEAFRRAIENLLINAVKYGDSTTPIQISINGLHGRAIVSVKNWGAHIPLEDQETLFHSFIRSQSARKSQVKGWGLGLAMVRGMAEGHGGSIAVDSAPERGTTFIIDVPIDSRPFLKSPVTPGT